MNTITADVLLGGAVSTIAGLIAQAPRVAPMVFLNAQGMAAIVATALWVCTDPDANTRTPAVR
ncbi:MAG: hypothetical protein ACR2OF_03780 [Hyphomicrobium sp.]